MVKKLFSLPFLFFYALCAVEVLISLDCFYWSSRYLYFSSEIVLALACGVLYFIAFKGAKWSDPFEPEDDIPLSGADEMHRQYIYVFFILSMFVNIVWLVQAIRLGSTYSALQTAGFYLFYVAICLINFLLLRGRYKFIDYPSMILATLIVNLVASWYETTMLLSGQGWFYNRSVIGYVFGLPIENTLYAYPLTISLCMIIYTNITRRMNNLKAFWLSVSILTVAATIVELIGIEVLNLWSIYPDKSILSFGKSCIEEFIYYSLFQCFSILAYIVIKKMRKLDDKTA